MRTRASLSRYSVVLGSMLCVLVNMYALHGTVVAHAETLDNLINSKTMQDFRISKTVQQRKSKKKLHPESQWLRGVDPNTNFGSLWATDHGGKALLNWVGAKLPYMQYQSAHGSRTKNFVTGEVELTNFDRVRIILKIIVPHPSITPLVEANILEEFRKIKPPTLEVVGEKDIPLTHGQGTLYEHKRGPASLVIPIAQHSVITLFTIRYKDAQALIDIAKELDIDRVNHKLDS
jgi:hypothetical protein